MSWAAAGIPGMWPQESSYTIRKIKKPKEEEDHHTNQKSLLPAAHCIRYPCLRNKP